MFKWFKRKKKDPEKEAEAKKRVEEWERQEKLAEARYLWLLGASKDQVQKTINALSFDDLWYLTDHIDILDIWYYNPIDRMIIDRYYELRPGRSEPFPTE
ncbi:MAG: hypothetical protein PVI03_03195 [Candidatus Thorarchaeota archaeon]|jgi:hypothetical protein